jgi:hypothetical protein
VLVLEAPRWSARGFFTATRAFSATESDRLTPIGPRRRVKPTEPLRLHHSNNYMQSLHRFSSVTLSLAYQVSSSRLSVEQILGLAVKLALLSECLK